VIVTNRVALSTQPPCSLSKRREVDATRKLVTECPFFVTRIRGSSTRLPTIVITVSFIAVLLLRSGRSGAHQRACSKRTGQQ
jgi:hypothetical protein